LVSVLHSDGSLNESKIDALIRLADWAGIDREITRISFAFFDLQELDSFRQQLRLNALSELGLHESAHESEIKNRYYELCKEYHPDKLGGSSGSLRKLAEEKLKAVNSAYESLRSGDDLLSKFEVFTLYNNWVPGMGIKSGDLSKCYLCHQHNRLPEPQKLHKARCGNCSAALLLPLELTQICKEAA
jgi:hypothetical protein